MSRGIFGLTTALLALCAIIGCFTILGLLGKLAIGDDASRISIVSMNCERGRELNAIDRQQLDCIKWSLMLNVFYSFSVMIIVRAEYSGIFEVTPINASVMILVGGILTVALALGSMNLYEILPFTPYWCNIFGISNMGALILCTLNAMIYFVCLLCSYLMANAYIPHIPFTRFTHIYD